MLAELLSGAAQAGGSRSNWYLHHVRHFQRGEPLKLEENEDRSLVQGYVRNGCVQQLTGALLVSQLVRMRQR